MDALRAWDEALFRAVHHGWSNPALDPIMKFLTEPGSWRLPLLLIAIGLFAARRARGVLALSCLVATCAISDQVGAKVLKPIFKRPRPSLALSDSRPLFGVRTSYSMPSVHAINFFAATPVVAAAIPYSAVPMATLAALVALSRVYVGDHYPGDILVGALLGLGIGAVGRRGFKRLYATLGRRWGLSPDRAGRPRGAITPSDGGAPSAGP